MNEPKARVALVADLHITELNRDLVLDSCRWAADEAVRQRCGAICVLGDWFDSRSRQGIASIETFLSAIF